MRTIDKKKARRLGERTGRSTKESIDAFNINNTKKVHNRQYKLWPNMHIYNLIGQAVAQERPAVVSSLLGVLKRKRAA